MCNPAFVDAASFTGVSVLETHPAEPAGANLLRLADRVVIDAAYPRNAERLRAHGIRVQVVDLSELAKAEGAVTCCSLVFA